MLCRTWPVSTLGGSIDWQLWCCMKSRFDWWGLRPSGGLAGGALRERRLFGRSVLLNGAHFELSALLSGYNGLITNVPALEFGRRRQPGQKPCWAVRGARGVNTKKKNKRRKDVEVREKILHQGAQWEKQIIRKGRKRETKSTEAQETKTEYQRSATEQYVTQIWQRNKTEREVGRHETLSQPLTL